MTVATIKAFSLYDEVRELAERCLAEDRDNSPESIVNGFLGSALTDALARLDVVTIPRLAARVSEEVE